MGLLATASTMEQDFYIGRLRDLHGLPVLVPDAADRRLVHNVIYDELFLGLVIERGGRRLATGGRVPVASAARPQTRSKRSRFITLANAAAKSCANFSLASDEA